MADWGPIKTWSPHQGVVTDEVIRMENNETYNKEILTGHTNKVLPHFLPTDISISGIQYTIYKPGAPSQNRVVTLYDNSFTTMSAEKSYWGQVGAYNGTFPSLLQTRRY